MKVSANLKNISDSVDIIPSKSVAHRKIIAAALSGLEIKNIYGSKDIEATKACIKSILSNDNKYYCKESGSTLRFLLPLAGALGKEGIFVTEGRLNKRPLKDLKNVLVEHGMKIEILKDGNIKVGGKLKAGNFNIRGDVSSQYISGLLFALPLLDGDSHINILGKKESESYINMTLDVLNKSGIKIENYKIKGNQKYKLNNLYIEGDWSNGAFWLCAGALLENGLTIKGLDLNTLQGDKAIIKILKEMGAIVETNLDEIFVKKNKLVGIDIDASDIPDLVPIVSLLASVAVGNTKIYNASRLKLKESDRLMSTAESLKSLGGDVYIRNDELLIKGKDGGLRGSIIPLDSYNDHRIAMMLAIASIVCEKRVIIKRGEAVNKSYPDFFEVAKGINGDIIFMEGE
ncbi:MAG TPA: 3-phosphoshikimate 1-carboxyvinyltransferase [Anaerovoracaceae bacterium]|nr:3-phosphoshikimate 1-carboxyvinyltransferase [Anaerovoracaceae bacterium]